MHAFRKLLLKRYFDVNLSKLNNLTVGSVRTRLLQSSSIYYNEEENNLEKNPYFEKYAEKIKRAQSNGLYTPISDQMCDQLTRETKQWKDKIEQVEKSLHAKQGKQSSNRGSKLPGKLGDLLRMELLEGKSTQDIAAIWTEYFKTMEVISAIIPADIYDVMLQTSRDWPMFLYPLPRDQGYEFILSQFDGNRCFFTSLINYQVHDANAPWQLCLTFYTELKESKGIVLMASEIDLKAMSTLEAQCLAQFQQIFYANPKEQSKVDLLKKFNHNPDAFKYMDLIHEIESSNLVVRQKNT